ncbi:RHOMBOID-like protein 1 [Nymphaea thermarum]|nr:RHOMBOID-like protein 1 [Nymphaea thermarum]
MGKAGLGDIESKVLLHNRGGNAVHPINAEPPVVYVVVPQQPEKSWFSWLIPLFVLANIALFALTMYVNDCPKSGKDCVGEFLGRFAFQPFNENPLLGPSSSTLDKMGALLVNKVVQGDEWWRLVTCMWLHAGVFHVLANMFSLLFIGIRLEQEFGFLKIGVLYVLAGFGGSLLSALFIQSSISVGASGALFGLLGAMLSELLTNWTIYANKFAALLTLVFMISLNLAVGVLPHVDNFAHIGGFISGFLLGFVILVKPQYGWVNQKYLPHGYNKAPVSKYKTYQYILLVIALILLIIWYVVGLVMLFDGVKGFDHCPWCHYLSCVPTSKWNCKPQNITCSSLQMKAELSLTCLNNGKMHAYPLANASQDKILDLCSQLCG